LPPAALDDNEFVEEHRAIGAADGDMIPYVAKQIGNVYAPLSMFVFYHPFTV